MKRQEQFAYLEERLCHLCNYIQYCNFKNYTDINRISEGFIRNIINIVYGYSCKDLNSVRLNYPGIDLGDDAAGIGIQVTSACGFDKVVDAYTKIYHPDNAIDGTLIAELYGKQIIFVCVSIDKKVKFQKKSQEEIKRISHGRFQSSDIVDMRDLISEIERLFDDDHKRFMKAYKCISENIDTLPEPVTDQRVLEELLHCFNRPAFTTDFEYECSMENFERAITETIAFINVGKSDHRTGRYSFTIEDFSSQTLKNGFRKIVDGLNMIRKLYLYMQDKAHMVKVNDKKAIYVDCEMIFCRAMNDTRALLLYELRRIAEGEKIPFDINPGYYEDSLYHSPKIAGDLDDFLVTLQKVYKAYIEQCKVDREE